MVIKCFEEIVGWQKSKELSLFIYELFKENRDFSFSDQIRRASVSIMNNIAEGFEKGTKNEFKQFLYTAKASCGEVRSMSYLAIELKYITQEQFNEIIKLTSDIANLTYGLSRSIKYKSKK